MSASSLFLVGIGITLLMSLTVVIYLMNPLRKILTELCGTRERADFWLAFSNVALMLTPLIFAASRTPDPGGSSTPSDRSSARHPPTSSTSPILCDPCCSRPRSTP